MPDYDWLVRWDRQMAAIEPDAFAALRDSLNGADPVTITEAVGAWMDAHPPSQTAVDVRNYGVTGSAVADERAAMQSALDAAAAVAPAVVHLAGLTVRCDSAITLPSGVSLERGTLDMSRATTGGTGLVYVAGTGVQGTYNLTGPLAQHAHTATLASAAGSVGDIVWIGSSDIHPSGEPGEYLGELNTIAAVSGSTVTLSSGAEYTYATAPYMKMIGWSRANAVRNVRIIGPSTVEKRGIYASHCDGLRIIDCEFVSCDSRGIHLETCWAPLVSGCKIRMKPGTAAANEARYGIGLSDNIRYGLVEHTTISGGRHAVAFTLTGVGGTSIDCTVTGTHASSTHGAAFATHQNSKRVSFVGNSALGCEMGFDVRAEFIDIIRNHVRTRTGATLGHAVTLRKNPRRIRVVGNRLEVSGYAVQTTELDATATLADLSITDNAITCTGSTGALLIAQNQNASAITGLRIDGNVIEGCTTTAITLDGAFDLATISRNRCDYATAQPAGVWMVRHMGGQRTLIEGNAVTNATLCRLEASTHSAPITPANISLFGNSFAHTGYLSTGAGSGITRAGNRTLFGSFGATISAASVTVPFGLGSVALSTAAATDLDTISGGDIGDVVAFYANSSTYAITFKDGVGNLRLAGDFTLTSVDDVITLLRTGTGWSEVSRSDNAA